MDHVTRNIKIINKKHVDKKTVLIVVVVAIAIVAVLLVFSSSKAPTNTSSIQAPITRIPDTVPGVVPGSMVAKVEKIQGQQIFFLSTTKKELSVTVGSATKIVKQVNNKGLFTDVVIKLSDIKPGQILEIITDSSGLNAKTIRVLQ